MTRPYRHPRTGVYWVRKAVPEHLRAAVRKRDLVRTLATKSPTEARQRAPAVLAQFDAILSRAAQQPGGGPATLKHLMALTGEWYRSQLAVWGHDPDRFVDPALFISLLTDQVVETEEGDPSRPDKVKLTMSDLVEAAALLRTHRLPTDPDTVARLAERIFWIKFRLPRR